MYGGKAYIHKGTSFVKFQGVEFACLRNAHVHTSCLDSLSWKFSLGNFHGSEGPSLCFLSSRIRPSVRFRKQFALACFKRNLAVRTGPVVGRGVNSQPSQILFSSTHPVGLVVKDSVSQSFTHNPLVSSCVPDSVLVLRSQRGERSCC